MALTKSAGRPAIVLLGFLAGCSPRMIAAHPHRWDQEACAVRSGSVVCSGRELARVQCESDRAGQVHAACRALGVHYPDGDVAWLFVASGFDSRRPSAYRPPDKIDFQHALSPMISTNGEVVWFGTRGILTRLRYHEYDIQTGRLRELGPDAEPQVRSAVAEGRAVPIDRGGSPSAQAR